MRERLAAEHDNATSEALLAAYIAARTKLTNDLLREIKAVEPSLSDHGPDHVANVLDNVHYLLSDDHQAHGLNAKELYLLGIIVLLHDVGNVYGREGHQTKTGEIFDWARGTDPNVRREKTLVMQAIAAHTGRAANGTFDTLNQISAQDHLGGDSVRLRDLAAILRFADELAEGPQRTSAFLLAHNKIPPSSALFHEYAAMTNIRPDRGTGRIMLTYEVSLRHEQGSREAFPEQPLRELLEFTYARAVKLDQERRYARFYSPVLSPFHTTTIAFNFHHNGSLLQPDIPPLILNDKVVPGEESKRLSQHDHKYDLDQLIPHLRSLAEHTTP